MFCLFKNARLYPRVNFYLIAAGWVGVLFWLEFTFIEKELVFKLIKGEAILVDLVFGLPLVLMLAVVIYATIYWFLKLIVVYVFPSAIMPASEYEEALPTIEEDPELQQQLEQQYGDEYWSNEHGEPAEELKRDDADQPTPDQQQKNKTQTKPHKPEVD